MEPGILNSNPSLFTIICMILGKMFYLSLHQVPHWENGVTTTTYFTDILWILK